MNADVRAAYDSTVETRRQAFGETGVTLERAKAAHRKTARRLCTAIVMREFSNAAEVLLGVEEVDGYPECIIMRIKDAHENVLLDWGGEFMWRRDLTAEEEELDERLSQAPWDVLHEEAAEDAVGEFWEFTVALEMAP